MKSLVDDFTVEFDADGPHVTLRVVGEVDLATAGVLTAELDRAIAGFDGSVTVNLGGVTFLDSIALCALLRARGALDASDRTLVVTEPGPATMRVFGLTGLLDTFCLATEPD
jgi:anti-sigma B factor antagonist